jgi:hypothetical protein
LARRILVVEEEFLVAVDLEAHLAALGHVCIGPVQTVPQAVELIANPTPKIDAAILELVVGGKTVDSLCRLLDARGVPFGFATGGQVHGTLAWCADRPLIAKPYAQADVARLLEALIYPAIRQ